VECVKMLVSAGANVEVVDFAGNNLAIIAVNYGQENVLRYIVKELDQKVDVLARNNKGETCMTIAEAKKLSTVTALLKECNEKYDDSKDLAL